MKGFFSESALISKQPKFGIARCGECGLYKQCQSPKMPVSGKGNKNILVVGEAPGKNEDFQNKQFVGDSGQLLEKALAGIGINMRKDCWLTNSLICRTPSNRKPTSKEVSYCRPNLTKTIRELQPHVILPFGGTAVRSLIGSLWKDDPGKITKWAGWQIPCQELNAWICPNYHPSAILREETNRSRLAPIFRLLFENYLHGAMLPGRPWNEVPDYRKQIEIIFDPDRVRAILLKMIEKGGAISFDLETDRLKPDHPDSKIICCSVCWEGKKTISFPWQGVAIKGMKSLLKSDLKKVGQNIKFEHRWIKKHLGITVKNWLMDDMLMMHVADNRRGITGLKFQAFVILGYGSYNDHIEPFLGARGSNDENRIKEIDTEQLLLYCGLDSLLEFKLYQHHTGRAK